jgi:hypothetical protein
MLTKVNQLNFDVRSIFWGSGRRARVVMSYVLWVRRQMMAARKNYIYQYKIIP